HHRPSRLGHAGALHQHVAGEEAAWVVEGEAVTTAAANRSASERERTPFEGIRVLLGDCLAQLPELPASSCRLTDIDPRFSTGQRQKRFRSRAVADAAGTRNGFGERRYRTIPDFRAPEAHATYGDSFDNYLAFLMPRIQAGLRCLAPDGSLFVH